MHNIKPIILKGSWVQLEPMNELHKPELFEAAQDESIWTFTLTKAFGERFYHWFDKAMRSYQAKQHLPFIVRRLADNKIVGSTRFYDIDAAHRRLTIGYTWYIPEVWGTSINTESKFLLLQFAFEVMQMNRVDFEVDSRNLRSRAAVKKLGAQEEGILRHHMVLEDGHIRDSVIYSIIKLDWPSVKSTLQNRLEALL